jgi:hypothetical protein
MKKKIVLLLSLLGIILAAQLLYADQDAHLYATGRMMEVDRCASAWLIKRHVDPDAEFVFFKDGELITRGKAFDTPDAQFCRTHNLSTFEILMAHFKVDDPKVKILAKAIHEVEINYWDGRKSPLANDLMMKINDIVRNNSNPSICMELSFKIFDDIVKVLSEV